MLFKRILSFGERIFALILFLFNPRKASIERNLKHLGIGGHRAKLAYLTYYNLFKAYKMLAGYIFFKKRPYFEIENEDYIKTGRLFVSIHYGPWDIALRLVKEKYSFVSVVGSRDILTRLRKKSGIQLVYSSDGLARVLKAARENRLALMLDRTYFEKGTYIKVGKSRMKISRAAFIIARRLKEDLFFIWAEPQKKGVKLRIRKIPYGSLNEMKNQIKEQINRLLLSHPEYWFNFFVEWA